MLASLFSVFLIAPLFCTIVKWFRTEDDEEKIWDREKSAENEWGFLLRRRSLLLLSASSSSFICYTSFGGKATSSLTPPFVRHGGRERRKLSIVVGGFQFWNAIRASCFCCWWDFFSPFDRVRDIYEDKENSRHLFVRSCYLDNRLIILWSYKNFRSSWRSQKDENLKRTYGSIDGDTRRKFPSNIDTRGTFSATQLHGKQNNFFLSPKNCAEKLCELCLGNFKVQSD